MVKFQQESCSQGVIIKNGMNGDFRRLKIREPALNRTWLFFEAQISGKFRDKDVPGGIMVQEKLLEILRCPACVKNGNGNLTVYKDSWLICEDCRRKYPVVADIPVMLIDEGSKWIDTSPEDLKIPPEI